MTTAVPSTPRTKRPALDWFFPVADELGHVETVLAKALNSARPSVIRLLVHLQNYRGKRLRPTLLLLAARACGKITAAHYTLGAVVEMIHTATLVHDDVLDNASIRRHHPTVNAGWDNQTSILLGDYLFTHAYHLASTLGDADACRMIGEATNRVCEGELQQGTERGNLALRESEYLDIIEGKTAALTACCCRLGAHYGGASPAIIDAMDRYGRQLGLAFQIADDVLDLVGEERHAGKSLGTDLDQRKLTLPLIYLLEQTAGEKADTVRRILCSPGNHKRDLLRPYLVDSGALHQATSRAAQFALQARAELDCLPLGDGRASLERLTHQVVRRES